MIPKFRAWDKIDKEMISWQRLLNGHNLRNVFMRPEMCGLKLMQATEFPDKLGNEIWHEDILDESYTNPMNGDLVVVRYIVEKENGMWKLKDFKGRPQYDRYLFMRSGQCTKIGNIYENPDLLEVAE